MVTNITDENFEAEVLKSPLPVLVDFWAIGCPPCQKLGPVIEELAEEVSGRVKVCKANIEEAGETATRYHVLNIPNLKFFRDGQLVGDLVALRPKEEIIQKIEEVFGVKAAS